MYFNISFFFFQFWSWFFSILLFYHFVFLVFSSFFLGWGGVIFLNDKFQSLNRSNWSSFSFVGSIQCWNWGRESHSTRIGGDGPGIYRSNWWSLRKAQRRRMVRSLCENRQTWYSVHCRWIVENCRKKSFWLLCSCFDWLIDFF